MTLTNALHAILRPEHTAFTRAMESLADAEAISSLDELDAVTTR
jgi:hypothetical protein